MIANQGLEGFVDALLNSQEYLEAFGLETLPYQRSRVLAGHAKPHRTLLLAARSDLLVNPQRNTVALAQTLQQQGAAVDMALFERVNHATLIGAMARPLRGLAPVLERVSGFLNPPSA